jgi:hypothetical protein
LERIKFGFIGFGGISIERGFMRTCLKALFMALTKIGKFIYYFRSFMNTLFWIQFIWCKLTIYFMQKTFKSKKFHIFSLKIDKFNFRLFDSTI